MPLLNKAGYPSTRNKAKQFRPQRIVENNGRTEIHWSDNMPQGMNSTGCFGVPSTFGVHAKKFGPQRGKRRDKRKKNGCRLISRDDVLMIPGRQLQRLQEVRGKILTLRIIETFTGRTILPREFNDALKAINLKLGRELPEYEHNAMRRKDEQRERSVEGRLRNHGLHSTYLSDIRKEVEFMKEKGLL
jgi:hypothetical protein